MKIKIRGLGFAILIVFLTASMVSAHCEVPCGIYDDTMRLDQIAEHVKTIEKSMNQINALGK